MALQIAEPRADSIDEILAFAQSHDSSPPAEKVVLSLSLLARDEQNQILGAAIFYHSPHGLACLDVICAQSDAQPPLIQQLVDKALLKLQSSNIRKCTLHTPGQDDPHLFWKTVEWDTQTFDLTPCLEDSPPQETDPIPDDEIVAPPEAA